MRWIALACVWLLLLAGAVAAQTTGNVTVGGRAVKDDGAVERAAEFLPTTSGPELALALDAAFDKLFLAVNSDAREGHDQVHQLTFEVARTVRSHTSFTRLPHRLVHDPLTNLRGVVKTPVVTWSTDLDPNARYRIGYDLLDHRTDFQFPQAAWLTVSAVYREQWREGHRQSLALSHCSTCHIQGGREHTGRRSTGAGAGGGLEAGGQFRCPRLQGAGPRPHPNL